MTQWTLMAMLSAFLLAAPARAQEKVAEGEYHMYGAGSLTLGKSTALDHWILYTRKQGGYRLESEVTSAEGTGVIVIQTEELTEQLNPTAITIKLYSHENTKKPFSTLSCHLAAEQIDCKAGGEELTLASGTDQKGPILFAINDLEQTDLPWMIAGAIRRAHFVEGKASLPTVVLKEGEDGLELTQTELDTLYSAGKDGIEMKNAKVPARRYRLENRNMKCWTSESGLMLKMEIEDGILIQLEKFKQYKKLVPELP